MSESQSSSEVAELPGQPAGDSPPVTGWARRRSNVAMRIEQAALQHFLVHGITGVTVDDIATASGISRRTFYRYFGTIDEVLTMMPRRALARISKAVHARPPAETIREAFLNGFKSALPDEDEREIQRLGSQLMEKCPDEWWQAMARVQTDTQTVFEQAVAERLRLAGRDPVTAPMIAATLIAAVTWVAQRGLHDEAYRNAPDAVEAALKDVSETLA
jgi:AcrR family transcriptional regulator